MQSVLERLAQTRRQVRRIVWIHGACWLIACGVAIIALAGLTDWVFHVSAGMRVLFLLMLASLTGFVAYRWLFRPLRAKLTDLELAQRLEKLHPELGEQLSSSIDFLQHSDDPLLGSKALRERVINSAMRAAEPIEFESLVDKAPAKKVATWAAVACGVAVLLAISSPSDAAIALRRLANPFGGPDWPQRTNLHIVEYPKKLPKGDAFAVAVEATGDVPSHVSISYRFEDGSASAPEPMRMNADGQFQGGLDSVSRPFAFSISGGDARTEWLTVDVVPAPELASLNLKLDFPEYTGMEAEEYPEGRGHVRAVVGTHVKVQARSTKPLQQAHLQFENADPVPAVVGSDPHQFTAEFEVAKDTQYTVILEDTEGMSNAYRMPKPFRVDAIEDRAPEISIEQPPGDIEVTPTADVTVKALTKDDFGTTSLKLRYEILRSDGSAANQGDELESIQLAQLTAPEKIHRIDNLWPLAPLDLYPGNVVRFFLEANDAKTPEPNLGKSRVVNLHIVTKDNFLQRLDNEQQLVREELERVLKMQQNALTQTDDLEKQANIVGALEQKDLEKLQSTELVQRRVREKLSDSQQSLQNQVRRLLSELKNNKIDDVESSKRLLLMQSELARLSEQHLPPITEALTEAEKTARMQANELPRPGQAQVDLSAAAGQPSPSASEGENAESKGSESTAEAKAAESKASESQESDSKKSEAQDAESKGSESKGSESKGTANSKDAKSEADAPAKAEMGKAKSSDSKAQERPAGNNPVAQSLGEAKEHQEQVVAALGQMLEQLNEWETIHQVTSDARDLQRRQAEVSEKVQELADQTLGKELDKLTKEERAEIAKSASRQEDSREQFLRLQRKMNRLAGSEDQTDPLTADLLKETLQQLQKENVGGKMAESADKIKSNRLGEAGEQQQQIQKALQELVSALENRQEQELARLVKKLSEAEQDLLNLREEQKRLLQKTKEAEQIKDPQQREEELKRLQRRQRELQQKAEEFAKRLSRLRAEQASKHSGRAASRMRNAGQQMQGQRGQQGQQQAQQEQEDALEELQQAQEELAKARQEAEEQLAEEQLAKISDALRQIHQRQLGVKDELMRLETIRKSTGRLSRAELHSVLSLARAQSGLSNEAEQLTEKLSQAKVFVLVIEEAVSFMREAAELLNNRRTDEPTQFAVDAAANRFAQLLDSLTAKEEEPKGKKQQQQQQQQQQGGGGGGGGNQDGIPSVAQIRLLKTLQKELLDRTIQLAKVRQDNGKWTDEQEKQFEKLSEQQGRLADLVRDLSKPAPEPDPDQGVQ